MTTHRNARSRSAILRVTAVLSLFVGLLPVLVGVSGAATHRTAPPATSLGTNGVVSRAMVAENARPGTTAWKIAGTPPTGMIEGFANTTDATPGQSVTFYVSSTASRFRLQAFRMGYYKGTGARLVWQSKPTVAITQAACGFTPGVNMTSCANWKSSLTVRLTKAFVPGDYLFKLVGASNEQSYVPLTLSVPTSHSSYLAISRSLTEAGWNTFGGYSFYQGLGTCAPTYPVCNRARMASFDRPFDSGNGASDFLSNEYPLVRFMESKGLDVSYVSDVELTMHPSLMANHHAILSLGHDETWTYPERRGVVTAMAKGVNIVYFGAAAVLRHARLASSALGSSRVVVDYRDPTEDPLLGHGPSELVTGNTFSSPPTNLSPTPLTGEVYSGYMDPGSAPLPMVVWASKSWLFARTGLKRGAQIPGVIDSDIDHVDAALSPSNLQVLAHSPVPLKETYTNQGAWNGFTYADTTYFSDPTSKAGVFDAGTVNWINAMSECTSASMCPAPTMRVLTGNLLHLFGPGPAGMVSPSTGNTHEIRPAGS